MRKEEERMKKKNKTNKIPKRDWCRYILLGWGWKVSLNNRHFNCTTLFVRGVCFIILSGGCGRMKFDNVTPPVLF